MGFGKLEEGNLGVWGAELRVSCVQLNVTSDLNSLDGSTEGIKWPKPILYATGEAKPIGLVGKGLPLNNVFGLTLIFSHSQLAARSAISLSTLASADSP